MEEIPARAAGGFWKKPTVGFDVNLQWKEVGSLNHSTDYTEMEVTIWRAALAARGFACVPGVSARHRARWRLSQRVSGVRKKQSDVVLVSKRN